MRLVTLSDALVNTGVVALGTRKRGGGGRRPVSDAFTVLDAAWEVEMLERGSADATREAYGRTARGYLVLLEEHGIVRLEDAGAATITGFLESLLDRWTKSSLFWVVSNFRPFLTFIGPHDLVDALEQLLRPAQAGWQAVASLHPCRARTGRQCRSCPQSHLRIDPHNEQVDEQFDDDDVDDIRHKDTEDHGNIGSKRGLHRKVAEAWQSEDHLDNDGRAQHANDLNRKRRKSRCRRIAQHTRRDEIPAGETATSPCSHVVTAKDRERRTPDEL